jgi:hypothetical protein
MCDFEEDEKHYRKERKEMREARKEKFPFHRQGMS